jgi:LacI family transcriptional regulator, galactose operon repressor
VKRAKIQDVARLADVSLSTVSAVLNGKDIVSEDTKLRVLDAVSRLNYLPSLYASNLARHRTRVLGLIVSNLVNPFFAETVQAFETESQRHGYQISLQETGFSPLRLRACVRQALGMRVAGLAVLTSEFDEESFALLKESDTSSVFLDVGCAGPHMGNIRVDTRGGMFDAVRHLVELGHRDILFVKNSTRLKSGSSLLSHQLRNQGFSEAIRKYRTQGVKYLAIDIPGPGAQAGLKAIRKALKAKHFTAVIAITDMVALGVYHGLREVGLRIPQDVSVIGFDNTYLSEFMHPPMTTVDIPRVTLCKAAVEMLLEEAASVQSGREVKVTTNLVIRDSTMPPNIHKVPCKSAPGIVMPRKRLTAETGMRSRG